MNLHSNLPVFNSLRQKSSSQCATSYTDEHGRADSREYFSDMRCHKIHRGATSPFKMFNDGK